MLNRKTPPVQYNFDSPIMRRVKAQALPLGHYERAEAEKAVKDEYSLCGTVEVKYRHLDRAVSPEESAAWVGKLVSFFRLKPVKRLIFSEPRANHTGGMYSLGEIWFPWSSTRLVILIHELTHHVMRTEKIRGASHGPEFVEMEALMLETTSQLLEEN